MGNRSLDFGLSFRGALRGVVEATSTLRRKKQCPIRLSLSSVLRTSWPNSPLSSASGCLTTFTRSSKRCGAFRRANSPSLFTMPCLPISTWPKRATFLSARIRASFSITSNSVPIFPFATSSKRASRRPCVAQRRRRRCATTPFRFLTSAIRATTPGTAFLGLTSRLSRIRRMP